MDEKPRATVYLDVDDDITSIIGKVTEAEHDRVALVIPKRSTVLQSAVNLKLVKKSAAESNKEPVLITEDPAITKIAAGHKILVAPSLQEEPVVPETEFPAQTAMPSDVIEGGSIGEPPPAEPTPKEDTPVEAAGAAAVTAEEKSQPATAKPKERKKALPDFDRFKKRFLFAILGIVGLGVLLWLILAVWPRATVTVDGRTEPLPLAFGFTADSEIDKPQYNNNLLPAHKEESSKTLSKAVTPTGKKDVGTKATGTITITNCSESESFSLSSGTTFTASSRNFLTDQQVTVPGATFSGGDCTEAGEASVPVTAAKNGESYNLSARSYSSSALPSGVEANGSNMSGGTSKTITVVTKNDVDTARNELLSNERAGVKNELADNFAEEEFIIEASFSEDVKTVVADPPAGQEATTARVSVEVEYSQIAVKHSELDELVKRVGREKTQEDDLQSLGVVNSGMEEAELVLKSKASASSYRFDVQTTALLGPDINHDELKERLAGKKFSEAVEIVKSYPNVNNADVDFSPFWVRKVPSNPEKVTIEIKLPEN